MKRFPHWGRKEGRKETRKGERGREAEGETFSLFLSFLAYDVTREERGVVAPRDGLLVCGPSPLECTVLLFKGGDHNKSFYPLFAGISHLITAWG